MFSERQRSAELLHRWKSASLRSQLVAMIMALLIVALTITGAGTLTLLHSYLQGQVDDKLNAAVNLASQQRSFTQLQTPNPMVLTDYSLTLFTPGQDPHSLRRRSRQPAGYQVDLCPGSTGPGRPPLSGSGHRR
jgi:hypothetical protein